MKYIFLLYLAVCLLTSPVMAQGQSTPDAPVVAETLALAEKMHEVWPIRIRVESAIEAVSKNFPEERQAEVKAAMRKNIQFDLVEEESIKAMATTYTAEELQAMIDFYGSETGRSISAKTTDYEMALRPIFVKMMDKAMLDLKTGTKP